MASAILSIKGLLRLPCLIRQAKALPSVWLANGVYHRSVNRYKSSSDKNKKDQSCDKRYEKKPSTPAKPVSPKKSAKLIDCDKKTDKKSEGDAKNVKLLQCDKKKEKKSASDKKTDPKKTCDKDKDKAKKSIGDKDKGKQAISKQKSEKKPIIKKKEKKPICNLKKERKPAGDKKREKKPKQDCDKKEEKKPACDKKKEKKAKPDCDKKREKKPAGERKKETKPKAAGDKKKEKKPACDKKKETKAKPDCDKKKEQKPACEKKKESKPVCDKKQERKPAVDKKKETKPKLDCDKKKETKPKLDCDKKKEQKPTCDKKKESKSKPDCDKKKELKPADEKKKETKPDCDKKKEQKPTCDKKKETKPKPDCDKKKEEKPTCDKKKEKKSKSAGDKPKEAKQDCDKQKEQKPASDKKKEKKSKPDCDKKKEQKPPVDKKKLDCDKKQEQKADGDKKKGKTPDGKKGAKDGKDKPSEETKNMAAVLYGIDDLRLETRPIPTAARGEVIIAIDSVGVCGTDVHFLEKGRVGNFVVKKTMIIGHEASGVVAVLGSEVKNLKIGDRVALEPGVPCGKCFQCKRGSYHLCPRVVFFGVPPHDGVLTNFQKHKADFCYKLPDKMTMEEGALLEPLAVGVHACRQGKISVGSNVLILGAGSIGMLTLLVAQKMGASKVMLADVRLDRLNFAKQLGATHTHLICPNYPPCQVAHDIVEKMEGQPTKTIDCCGVESSVEVAVMSTRPGGTVVLVGMDKPIVPFPMIEALSRELKIIGSMRYVNDYPAARSLASNKHFGKLLRLLVTHHFDMKDTLKAFALIRQKEKGTLKVIIHVQPRDKNNKTPFKN